jgi:SAM-dependent methyltransferase
MLNSPYHPLEPCPLVRRFGGKVAEAADDLPILDVACGSGRNAILLGQLGCTVICMDKDLRRLQTQQSHLGGITGGRASERLIPYQIDLVNDPWPFTPCSVGGIINTVRETLGDSSK